jgi:anti-repressor protein
MELIKIKTTKKGSQVVSARELHKYLESTERFSTWAERQFQYGLEENIDYAGCKTFNTLANQELKDYVLTIDAAKIVSMIQKSEKGNQARRYFIEVEKKLKNNLPTNYIESLQALLESEKEKQALQLENKNKTLKIEQDAPKVVFADSVAGSSNSVLIRDFAKMISDDEFKVGQNRLFKWFRENKYLMNENKPYQKYVDMGLFEVIERSVGSSVKTFTRNTTKITGKGKIYFTKKIKS